MNSDKTILHPLLYVTATLHNDRLERTYASESLRSWVQSQSERNIESFIIRGSHQLHFPFSN